MIKLTTFLILFFVNVSLACEIELPHHILILGEGADFSQSESVTGCTQANFDAVNSTLRELDGKVAAYQLEELLSAKNSQVKIKPTMVQIQHLKNLVRDQLMIPSGVHLKSSRTHDRFDFVTLSPGDRVEVQCLNCLYGAQQPLNLIIRGFDGTNKSIMVTADFKKMVKAYRLTSFQPAFSEMSQQFLREEYVESIPHTDLVTDLSTLKFYKLNKPLKAGDLLRKSDLNAQNLVKAGLKTDVIIENELIRLKTTGISRSNGTLGELVEVFHPQKNKKYQGKVIDNNKVLVEL